LRYATVTGNKGSKLNLHHHFPTQCTSVNDNACKSTVYIVSGDAVAIGETCGSWAYVQYIGHDHVTTGWVEAVRLIAQSTIPQHVPVQVRGHLIYQSFPFKLTKGRELPVCEAYLQRLNVTVYERPPYCDRPENDEVPGFILLNRVSLDPIALNVLFPSIYNFWFPRPAVEPDDFRALRSGSVDVSKDAGAAMSAWRYDPPVDLNNNGMPDNVLVWRGYGVSNAAAPCGASAGYQAWGYRQRQVPLIMNADNKSVAADKTAALLDSRVPLTALQKRSRSSTGARSRFKAIGRSVGIFRYRDLYYLDAFSEPSANYIGEHLKNPRVANTLSVFLRRGEQTTKVCEYVLSGNDYPTLDDGE
jgi:hypothetical protein